RDSVHTSLQSSPATGNSFIIVQTGNSKTGKFNIAHHAVCTLSGGVTNSGFYLWVGPYEGVGVDRSFLMFDTSSLGTGVTVTSATLKLDYQFFEYLAEDSVTNVHESNWALPGAYSGYVGNLLASQTIAASRPFGLVPFTIRPDYISKTGITKFALKAANEDFSVAPNADVGYYRPTSHLEVTYTVTDTSTWPGPQLLPLGNTTSDVTPIDRTFQWNETMVSDGDPVHYQVEISSAADFSTLYASSPWLPETTWTHPLPAGTWYWRVTARDAVHTDLVSLPAASSFIITYLPPPAETSVTCSATSGDIFPLGATLVTCQAVDACSRSAEGSFTITVQDTTEPTLFLPADIAVEAVTANGAPIVFETAATDSVDPTPVVACSPASGSTFPLGDSLVTCTAEDASGNIALGLFQVTVTEMKRAELTVPGDLVVEATAPLTMIDIGQATVVHSLPVALSNDAPEAFPVGTTVVTWTATDSNDTKVSATQSITVVDTTPPIVTPLASLTVEASGLLTPVAINQANATDAVGVVSLTSDAPTAFPLGLTTVTWTAVDAAGNLGTTVQTVNVVDRTPPTLEGVADQVLEATAASGAVAAFTVTASDLVDPSPVVTCSAASGSIFSLGESTVTCSGTDLYGNHASANLVVQVRDTTPPVLTVPADITVLLNTPLSDSTIQNFLHGATAEDVVDATVSVHSSAPGELNSVGTKEVTFTAVDNSGNRSTGTALIRVVYGGGDEFLSPVGLLKPFKLGSTIPVKIEFSDFTGAAVTQAVVQLYLYPVSGDVPAEEPLAIESTSSTDTGNHFRVSEGVYIYNLSTRSLASGTYQIRADLDDGTIRTVQLALKP
ncbi:MAG: HYR domain-containing protein, partial [Desulfuromonadales bacterium]|nr:HYR domain-containing protein [Desulfuromonadales bacterium]